MQKISYLMLLLEFLSMICLKIENKNKVCIEVQQTTELHDQAHAS